MKSSSKFFASAVLLVVLGAPVQLRAQSVALMNGTLHPVSGPEIQHGVLLMQGDRIVSVGNDVDIPSQTRVIDLQGQHVYPALINPNSVIGLVEVSSVPGTVDIREMGEINPNVRAERSINPDSELFGVTNSNGVLVSMVAGRGGLISGTAAVIRHDGWTWEDMTLASPVGLLINWPDMRIRTGSNAKPKEEQMEERDRQLQLLRDSFANARAYQKAIEAEGEKGVPVHDRDPRWEAMLPVLRGEIPVMVSAEDLLQIRAALRFAEEEQLEMILIARGDVWRVADELAEKDIPVILRPTTALPLRRYEPYDTPFTIANKLYKAGVRFCFGFSSSGFGAAHARNLPYNAALAAAYGLPREEALRGVTLSTAEILGVGDRLGSLEAGKEATLIVTDGDPLEIRTQVTRAFVAGREIDLNDRHKRLYEKYRNRPQPDATPAELPTAVTRRK